MELVLDHDNSGLQAAFDCFLLDVRIFRQFGGIKIDIAQPGGAGKIGVQLAVDRLGDLFQRPAGASTTRAGIQVSRPEDRENRFGDWH